MIGRRIAAVLLAASLAACGDEDRQDAAREQAAAPADSAVAPPPPLALLLDVPGRVRAGEPVPVTATLVNEGRDSVRLELGGRPEGPSLDVVVTRPDGREVWRRSRHETIPSGAFRWTLKPGEVIGTGTAWDQRDDDGAPVSPGTYHVRGILHADPRGLTTGVGRLVITPP